MYYICIYKTCLDALYIHISRFLHNTVPVSWRVEKEKREREGAGAAWEVSSIPDSRTCPAKPLQIFTFPLGLMCEAWREVGALGGWWLALSDTQESPVENIKAGATSLPSHSIRLLFRSHPHLIFLTPSNYKAIIGLGIIDKEEEHFALWVITWRPLRHKSEVLSFSSFKFQRCECT